MLIRTQGKRCIVNLNNVVEIGLYVYKKQNEIKEKYTTDIKYYTEKASNILGTYSSEEKALKVLDIIQEAYLDPIISNKFLDNYNTTCIYQNTVFQMPADDEVNV